MIYLRAGRRLLTAFLAAALIVAATACSNDTADPPITTLDVDSAVVGGCYTGEGDPGVPRGVNRYALALIDDPGVHAGLLDEYSHCRYLPALDLTADSAVVGGCYTGEGDPGVPRGVNRYALALIDDPGVHAGLLDEYSHCRYLPAELLPAR